MSNISNEGVILIKDVKPGSKNLNIVFIVLEIGKWIHCCVPRDRFLARAANSSVLTFTINMSNVVLDLSVAMFFHASAVM